MKHKVSGTKWVLSPLPRVYCYYTFSPSQNRMQTKHVKENLLALFFPCCHQGSTMYCSTIKTKIKQRLNLPAVDTGPYFETQYEDHGRDKEKVQAATQHRGHGVHPCGWLLVEANGFCRHAALHRERKV